MGSSEPSLVPEWLKSNAGGQTGNHSASSTSHTASLARCSVNKSSRNIGESGSPLTLLNRSSSSNSRRSSGSRDFFSKHPYSSFSRSHRDREKERLVFRDPWDHNCFGPRGKEFFRRSSSMISRKQEGLVLQRGASEFTNNDTNNIPNGKGFHDNDFLIKSIKKAEFERESPTVSAINKHGVPDVVRAASPVLTAGIQGLPIGTSASVGEGWSAFADVPAVVGSESDDVVSPHVHQPPEASLTSRASSPDSGLNMAKTLAQSPVTIRTASQVSTDAQKLKELAIKQSRQLIPMTPVTPKPMALSSGDKSKPKIAVRNTDSCNTSKIGLQLQASGSAHLALASQSPRGAQSVPEYSKTTQVGKLYVLKPPWENSASPVNEDGFAMANDASSKCSENLSTSVVSTVSLSNSTSPTTDILERKATAPYRNAPSVLDKKRMLSPAQSRNEFFNSMRKKALMKTPISLEATSATSVPVEQSIEVVHETAKTTLSSNGFENGHCNCNGGAHQQPFNEENNYVSITEVIPDEEEEAAFLRSLGWEENGSEDDALTEEEINTFYQEVMKVKPTLKQVEAVQQPNVSLLHKLMLVEVHPH